MDYKKKKIALISFFYLLHVVAVVGTLTPNMGNNNANQEKTPAETTTTTTMTNSSKSVQIMCESTNYKDVCIKTLSEAQNTSDPKALIKVAMKAAIKEIGIAIKDSALLQKDAKDPMASKSLTNCKDYLDTSIEKIDNSIFKVDELNSSLSSNDDQMQANIEDLMTWMSSACTYLGTCLDEFEGETGEKMRNLLIPSTELTSNALAMANELTNIPKSNQTRK